MGDLKPAVIAYTVMHIPDVPFRRARLPGLNSGRAGRFCISGALLFVLSDSMLAVEKFLMRLSRQQHTRDAYLRHGRSL